MFKLFFKLILVLIIAVILTAGYLGFVPGLSTIMGADKPKDLGITYTQDDFQAMTAKSGITRQTLPETTALLQSAQYEGSHELNTTYTSQDLTALINESKWKYNPLENIQIKFNPDGTTEVSASINKEKIFDYAASVGVSTGDIAKARETLAKIPITPNIYVKGTFEINNNQVTSLNLSQVQIGKFNVPGNIVSSNQHYLGELAQMQFKRIPEFNAQSVKVEDSQLKFKGTIPAVEKIAE